MECPRCIDGNDNMKSKTTRRENQSNVTIRKCVVCGYKETK